MYCIVARTLREHTYTFVCNTPNKLGAYQLPRVAARLELRNRDGRAATLTVSVFRKDIDMDFRDYRGLNDKGYPGITGISKKKKATR